MAPLSLRIVQDNGTVTKKVKLDPNMTVREAHAIIKEKTNVKDGADHYGLFLRAVEGEPSGVWLEAARTLAYYMLRDGDRLEYASKLRNLRIKTLDDSVKTMQLDQSKLVVDLMITICSRLGITNHEEYGLCLDEEEETEGAAGQSGTLTLRKKTQLKDRDLQLEQLSKKLKTDDNVEWIDAHKTLSEAGLAPDQTVLLMRRLYYSDRKVDSRDPVQLNLLYVQARDNILDERHPVTEDQDGGTYIAVIGERVKPLHRPRPSTPAGEVPSLSRPGPLQSPIRDRHGTMPPTLFSKNVDLKLIQLVKENPVLYNPRHPKYTDSDTREVTWQKIGDALSRPARKCKLRWLNIRDMMRRTIRNRMRYPDHNQHKYRFEDEVAFAIPYFKYTNTPTEDYTDYLQENSNPCELPAEVLMDDNINFDNDNEMLEVKPTLTFKKRAGDDASSSREYESSFQELSTSDPMDVFLMTIGSTLKKLSPLYMNQAKSKIFQIVQDFELKQIVEKESQNNDVLNSD